MGAAALGGEDQSVQPDVDRADTHLEPPWGGPRRAAFAGVRYAVSAHWGIRNLPAGTGVGLRGAPARRGHGSGSAANPWTPPVGRRGRGAQVHDNRGAREYTQPISRRMRRIVN